MPVKPILAVFLFLVALGAGSVAAATVNVTLSGASPANFENRLSDTGVEVARFVLTGSGGSVVCTGVTITFTNPTGADEAFTAVRLFYDANGNNTFEAGEELGTPGGVAPNGSAATISFNTGFTVPVGSRLLQVTVNTGSNPAAYGQGFRFSIAAGADVALSSPGTDNVTGTFPVQGNTVTVRNSVTNLLAGTGNPAALRTVPRGTQNAAGLHFRLDCLAAITPGELVGLKLQTLTVNLNLGSAAHATVISAVSLFNDAFDALFEPNTQDILVQTRTSADVAQWQLSGAVLSVTFDGAAIAALSQVNSGAVRAFWVGVSFNTSADAQLEVILNRTGILGTAGGEGDFISTAIASVSGNVITVTGSGGGGGGSKSNGVGEEGGCAVSEVGALPWLMALLALLTLILQTRVKAQGAWRH